MHCMGICLLQCFVAVRRQPDSRECCHGMEQCIGGHLKRYQPTITSISTQALKRISERKWTATVRYTSRFVIFREVRE